jgi:hypothetical protein
MLYYNDHQYLQKKSIQNNIKYFIRQYVSINKTQTLIIF